MTFSTDAEARLQVVTAALNVGWPDNDPVLKELLRIRHEHAQLLGYADWAAFDAEVKMIGSGPAIARFNDELAVDSTEADRKSQRLTSSHSCASRMPSSARKTQNKNL